jgi:two-component system response regulator RegA
MAEDINNPTLLLADDDEVFCDVLMGALSKRGFDVSIVHSVEQGIAASNEQLPEYAVVDLNMPGDTGLSLVEHLCQQDETVRVVVLTGYASVATAVEAIKLGAVHYLAKPADADEIVSALYRQEGDSSVELEEQPMSVKRLEWEHIQKVLNEVDGNISEAARRLNMHRRTLQRKLQKRPVKK